jgi:hypothetical protein
MLYCTVHALGEMAVLFPVAGSFSAYSTRFLDPAWGFAMGWVRTVPWFQRGLSLTKLELCIAMARSSASRSYLRIYYNQLLENQVQSCDICDDLSDCNYFVQFDRSERLW